VICLILMKKEFLVFVEIEMKKIFISTPMYGGQCYGFYAQSLLQLNNLLRDNNIESMMSFMFNESLITRGRNALAHAFMKSNATHLMFIDADIHFNPADFLKMLEADKDVICGIYPKKEINWASVRKAIDSGVPDTHLKYHTGSFVANLKNYVGEATVPVNEPVEIWNGGTGFMLIKRDVFEKMKPVIPWYINDVTDLSGTIGAEQITQYFTESIEPETKRLLSEDYHFCKTWRDLGGEIHAAPWANLSHIGTYAFDGKLIPSP
jgi:hypothetical protein